MQQALDRVSENRTVLVIAHRLSTVQTANEVAVVSGGVIAERGTHSDLVERGKSYTLLPPPSSRHRAFPSPLPLLFSFHRTQTISFRLCVR